MAVIHIYGASGSGTTTLGRALQAQCGYAHLDADDYFWLPTDPPFTAKRPPNERVALLRRDLARPENAVLTGSLCGWGDALTPLFTLAVRLTVPTQVRLARLRLRELARFGSRIAPGGDMYENHTEFLVWASGYDEGDENTRSKALHDTWQQGLACRCLTLDGTLPTQQLVAQVLAAQKMPHCAP